MDGTQLQLAVPACWAARGTQLFTVQRAPAAGTVLLALDKPSSAAVVWNHYKSLQIKEAFNF